MSQVVLVTGCSSGFGELIAQTLARAGHHVFATMRGIADRNPAAAEKFHQLAAAEQLALDVVEMDVASDASVARGVDQVIAQAESHRRGRQQRRHQQLGSARGLLGGPDGSAVERQRARADARQQGGARTRCARDDPARSSG